MAAGVEATRLAAGRESPSAGEGGGVTCGGVCRRSQLRLFGGRVGVGPVGEGGHIVAFCGCERGGMGANLPRLARAFAAWCRIGFACRYLPRPRGHACRRDKETSCAYASSLLRRRGQTSYGGGRQSSGGLRVAPLEALDISPRGRSRAANGNGLADSLIQYGRIVPAFRTALSHAEAFRGRWLGLRA